MQPLQRRQFLGMLGSGAAAAVVGFDEHAHSWIQAIQGSAPPPAYRRVPRLDGTLLSDSVTRQRFSRDDGNLVRRVPAAVLRPGSVRDIVRMLRFASEQRIKVALRGQGHSRYGQTLVDGGLVIDTSALDGIGVPSGSFIDVQPGALWGRIADATIPAGLTPPVMPDTMRLSAGGTLSVGGFGNTSYRYGAQTDQVEELEVVTGRGDVVTCSRTRSAELFDMVLGGLGQCAVIVRARLRLVAAPTHVLWQELWYDDVETWLADHLRAAQARRFDHHGGGVMRQEGGAYRFVIYAGAFEYAGAPRRESVNDAGLRFASQSAPRRMTYREYLHRQNETITEIYSTQRYLRPSPYITMFVPAAETARMVRAVMATEERANVYSRFGVWPVRPDRITRPLVPMPRAADAFVFWLFRTADPDDREQVNALMESNRRLLAELRLAGGVRYSPYATFMTPSEWRQHLGDAGWQRLAAAKRRFDPGGVLSPGPGIFTA